ncbi:alpha/beta hydrolase [Kribbella antibiotica]|uniref:Alpha/beta hydrolase n=1 Tax=Kribbella antibiotica TaxID=190195 RepID=A0A4R4ZTI8_9ACTN|nr:alpha/beta hydrolase [Kribbella antibiotica]TDD62155.1 alpha/beta hydrolase [Kribbella antibiotica]
MWSRRSFLALSSLAATLPMATLAHATSTQADLTLRLPAPTGPHRIGVRSLQLIQRGRRDPWIGTPDRDVMLSIFYPALTTHGYPVAPQMTPAAAAFFNIFDAQFLHSLPTAGVNWAATLTHSHVEAPALPGHRPVILYSPGGIDPRTLGTGTAEELASHGYIVITIDHPGETSEVELSTGELRRIKIPPTGATDPVILRLMISTRLADIAFVLSQLKTIDLPLDLRRVGIYGHSAGGATAAEALYENRGLRSAINLEGYLDYLPLTPGEPNELYPIAQHGTDRPVQLTGTDGYRDDRFDSSWSALLSHGGPVRRTELTQANHWVFTDLGTMAAQCQQAGLMTAENRAKLVGTIAPGRSVPWIRNSVRSFFDRTLRC